MPKKPKRKHVDMAEEYTPPFEQEESIEPQSRYRIAMIFLLDQGEVNRLINASESEYVEPPRDQPDAEYASWHPAEVPKLIDGTWQPPLQPRHSKKKK